MQDILISGHLFATCRYGRYGNPFYVCLNCKYVMYNIMFSTYNLRDPLTTPLLSCAEVIIKNVLE